MTMTTGELDYDDIFHQQEGEEEIAFLPTSFILWIVFLVLISSPVKQLAGKLLIFIQAAVNIR